MRHEPDASVEQQNRMTKHTKKRRETSAWGDYANGEEKTKTKANNVGRVRWRNKWKKREQS